MDRLEQYVADYGTLLGTELNDVHHTIDMAEAQLVEIRLAYDTLHQKAGRLKELGLLPVEDPAPPDAEIGPVEDPQAKKGKKAK